VVRLRRLLLPIQAYIDDSGVRGTDPVFVLTGYIDRADKWAEFSDAWKTCLAQLPSVRYLKMYEAAKLNGEFRFWNETERDKKLQACVDVIKRFPPATGLYFISDLIAWDRLVDNPVKTLTDPHFAGFYAVISGVCNEALDSGTTEEVEIIFDEHLIFGPRVALWYPVVREMFETSTNPDLRNISPIMPPAPLFRDDRKFAPLQAADMLAWMMRNAFKDRLPGLESVWRPAHSGFEWLAAQFLPLIRPSKYSTIWGDKRIARIQELSQEMQYAPHLLAKWRKQLGIRSPRIPKRKKPRH
jgi:hypothetical protein